MTYLQRSAEAHPSLCTATLVEAELEARGAAGGPVCVFVREAGVVETGVVGGSGGCTIKLLRTRRTLALALINKMIAFFHALLHHTTPARSSARAPIHLKLPVLHK